MDTQTEHWLGIDFEGTLVIPHPRKRGKYSNVAGIEGFLATQAKLRNLFIATIAHPRAARRHCRNSRMRRDIGGRLYTAEELGNLHGDEARKMIEGYPVLKDIKALREQKLSPYISEGTKTRTVFIGDDDIDAGFSYPEMPVIMVPTATNGQSWATRGRVDSILKTLFNSEQKPSVTFDTLYSGGAPHPDNSRVHEALVRRYDAGGNTRTFHIDDTEYHATLFAIDGARARVIWEKSPLQGIRN